MHMDIVMKHLKKLKKLYGPFLWMRFNCLKATATSRRQFTFYRSVPRNSWSSFYRPRKDERLSRPWSHPVVLNMGLLDWKSSTLTTRPVLLIYLKKGRKESKSMQLSVHGLNYFQQFHKGPPQGSVLGPMLFNICINMFFAFNKTDIFQMKQLPP